MTCLSALAVALILVLAGGKPAGAAPVRIAYSSISGAMLPLWVAKDKGLFDKYGVEVELAYIRGVAIEALLSGEVHFVRASPPAVVRSTLRGADLAIIANTINVAVFSLMSKPDLKRPEDLKGKKIGVTNLGDSPDLVLSLLLEKWGLQRNKDVAVLGIRGGMPELLVSVSKGFVDAGMISAPSNLRGIKLGLRGICQRCRFGDSLPQLAPKHASVLHKNPARRRAARPARLLPSSSRNAQRPQLGGKNPSEICSRRRRGDPLRSLPYLWGNPFTEKSDC